MNRFVSSLTLNGLSKRQMFSLRSEIFNSKMTIAVKLFLVGVLIAHGGGDSSSIIAPNNTATVAGSRLVLRCSTTDNDSFVREWKVKRTSDPSGRNYEPQLIFSHWSNEENVFTISPGFGAQVDAFGSVVLYKNSSRFEDAGLYTCVAEVKGKVFRYSAYVVIFEPTCEASFKSDVPLRNDDRLWMRCNVTYRGSISPIIQWRRHYLQGNTETVGDVVTEGLQANTVADSNISSTLSIVVSLSKDDIRYSCRIFFPSFNSNDSEHAGNAPEFSYKWKSPVVRGQWITTDGYSVYGFGPNSEDVTKVNDSTHWFVISLALGAGMLGVFILMAVVTTTLCCRMKSRMLQADLSQQRYEASARNKDDDYDVIPNDTYERIGDVTGDGDAFNVTSTGDRCSAQSPPGYINLRPSLHQRQSSSLFQIYHQDNPVQSKPDLTGPVVPGQADYLTIQESDMDAVPPGDPRSPYLALVRDSGDLSSQANRLSDYLKPYVDIQTTSS